MRLSKSWTPQIYITVRSINFEHNIMNHEMDKQHENTTWMTRHRNTKNGIIE